MWAIYWTYLLVVETIRFGYTTALPSYSDLALGQVVEVWVLWRLAWGRVKMSERQNCSCVYICTYTTYGSLGWELIALLARWMGQKRN